MGTNSSEVLRAGVGPGGQARRIEERKEVDHCEGLGVGKIRVTMVMRRRRPGFHSVERLFETVAANLPSDIQLEVVEVPFPSHGIVNLARNVAFVSRIQADVIHITGDITYCAMAAPWRTTIVTVLDLVSLHRLRGLKRWFLKLGWYSIPCSVADGVTAISQFVADELEEEFGSIGRDISVIHCPLDGRMKPGSFTSVAAKTRGRVLQVGSTPTKNFPALIDAMEGTGLELRRIGALSRMERDRLARSGIVYSVVSGISDEDLVVEFQSASLLAFLSSYEGFGMPVIEAQACGLPVLSSTAASLPEVAGSGAVFVDPEDTDRIREALIAISSDEALRKTLISRGLANVARFDPKLIASQYADEYRRLYRAGECCREGRFRLAPRLIVRKLTRAK